MVLTTVETGAFCTVWIVSHDCELNDVFYHCDVSQPPNLCRGAQ